MNSLHMSTGLRMSLASATSLLMTFVILAFMKSLIGGDGPVIIEKRKLIPLPEFIFSTPPPPDPTFDRIEPPGEIVDPPPEPVIPGGDETGEVIEVTVRDRPAVDGALSGTLLKPQFNTELAAVVEIQPEYPRWAIRKGIEGYVLVEFTVTRSGSTQDIKVLDAYPDDTFNRSAIRAAGKSRFKPRIVNGSPVAVTGMQKKYTFLLDD